MSKLFTKRRLYDLIVCLALALTLSALTIFPEESVMAGSDGISLCLNVIIPSLFPFFVISSMVVELGIAARLGRIIEPIMSRLFNVNGSCSAAFVLGFIGGYPVGARTAISLYKKGECSKSEAERLLSFCNNSGPAFILGVVGAGVFSSSLAGLLLYLAHTLASIIIGILFRNWGTNESKVLAVNRTQIKSVSFTTAFSTCVKSSVSATLNICGFVIFFTVFIRLLFLSGLLPLVAGILSTLLSSFGMTTAIAENLLTGIIEISSGVSGLKEAAPQLSSSIAMASFMLGWAGLSVHCQALSFLCDSGLSARTYISGKLLHGFLSAAIIFIIFKIIPQNAPVSAYLAEQVTGIATLDFTRSLLLSTGCSVVLMLCLVIFSLGGFSKKSGKQRRKRL